MTEDISRRRLLELGGAILGGSAAAGAAGADRAQSDTVIRGWVMEDERRKIADRVGVVEEFQHRGLNLCNDGKVYRCRTCEGFEFHLLVTRGASVPTAGDTYRFESTDRESGCGNFQVRLREATGCEDDTVRAETNDSRTETTDGESGELSPDRAETTTQRQSGKGAQGGSDAVDTSSEASGTVSEIDTVSENSKTTATEAPTTTASETTPATSATVEPPTESDTEAAAGSTAEPDTETTAESADGD